MTVPTELWLASATAVDTPTGDVLVGHVRVYIDVAVSSPATQTRGASRAALDRFTHAFDQVMCETERRYTVNELVDAAQTALGDVSALEIEAALKRMSPAGAGSGRRAAHVVPTQDELARAARQAAETHV